MPAALASEGPPTLYRDASGRWKLAATIGCPSPLGVGRPGGRTETFQQLTDLGLFVLLVCVGLLFVSLLVGAWWAATSRAVLRLARTAVASPTDTSRSVSTRDGTTS